MNRVNRKGRSNDSGRFVQLHHFMLESVAWKALSAQERCVYIAVLSHFNGTNNGRIVLGVRRAAELANVHKDTAGRCFIRLQALGFIECACPGGFSRKTPHATEWRLTSYRCDRTHALPSKAYMRWRPGNAERGPSVSAFRALRSGQSGAQALPIVPPFRTAEAI